MEKNNKIVETQPDKKMAERIQYGIDSLYRRIYFTNPMNKNSLEIVKRNMDKSLDDLVQKSAPNGVSISSLYSRIATSKTTSEDTIKAFDDIFNDKTMMDSILSSYMDNRHLQEIDIEYDTILKYMPQLKEALKIKKDNVLTADDYSKNFINLKNMTRVGNNPVLNSNMKEIKNAYNLESLVDEIYDNMSVYGEQFIYTVPYNKALSKLIDLNSKGETNGPSIRMESSGFIGLDGSCDSSLKFTDVIGEGKTAQNVDLMLEVTFNDTSIIPEALREARQNGFDKSKLYKIADPLISKDSLEFDSLGDTAQEHIVGVDGSKSKVNVNVNGCIVKKLLRKNVLPIIIDDIVLGYYYIESQHKDTFDYISSIHDPMAAIKNANYAMKQEETKKDNFLKNLSSRLSKEINSKFINSNPDLSKEIYIILKHNYITNNANSMKLNVTFLPPEDVFHFYFDKDPKTNRGKSDLEDSLIPAKMYSVLWITNTLGIITRGHDKRAYFVKQFVDTNISKTLLTTIDQIKKGNFGLREIGAINNILNITGKFNDYVIPVGQSGEKPIDFEIIPGQDINPNTELMEMLEGLAINPTGIPVELVDIRQQADYATRLVITNTKVMRMVIKRQAKLAPILSALVTRIYNLHFNANEELYAMLPPPAQLNIQNMLDLIGNARQVTDQVVDMQLGGNNDDEILKDVYTKNVLRYFLGTAIDMEHLDMLLQMSKIEKVLIEKEKEARSKDK